MRLFELTGRPLILFHGSPADVSSFRAMAHFGTLVAAKQRLRHWMRHKNTGGTIYEVALDINNPLRVTDAEASDEASLLLSIKRGLYPQLDLGIANRDGAYAAVEQAGYDGLVYNNRMEDRGKLSYVILRPEQAKILKRIPMAAPVPKKQRPAA